MRQVYPKVDKLELPIILEKITVYEAYEKGGENFFLIETDSTEAVKIDSTEAVDNPKEFGQILEQISLDLVWKDPELIQDCTTFYNFGEQQKRKDQISFDFPWVGKRGARRILNYPQTKPVGISNIAKQRLEVIPVFQIQSLIRFKPNFYHKVWVIGKIFDISIDPFCNDMKLYLIRYLIKVFTYRGQAILWATWSLFKYEHL